MKIKLFIFFLIFGVILSGVMAGAFIFGVEMREVPGSIDKNKAPTTESFAPASISEGTILLLLAMGVIGALGVSRKKKDSGSDSKPIRPNRAEQHVNVNEDRKN
jgi:hypothetical protein